EGINAVNAGDFTDFFRQVPPSIYLVPLFLLILDVGLMVVMFRRGAERRRRKREAEMMQMGLAPASAVSSNSGSRLAALRNLPEPDLDTLVTSSSQIDPSFHESIEIESEPARFDAASTSTPEPDWQKMVTPVQQEPVVPDSPPVAVPDDTRAPGDA